MSASYMRRCSGKERHETREQAAAHRASLAGARGLPVSKFSIYPCDQCQGLHVGNADRTFKTRSRRAGKRPNKRMRGR